MEIEALESLEIIQFAEWVNLPSPISLIAGGTEVSPTENSFFEVLQQTNQYRKWLIKNVGMTPIKLFHSNDEENLYSPYIVSPNKSARGNLDIGSLPVFAWCPGTSTGLLRVSYYLL